MKSSIRRIIRFFPWYYENQYYLNRNLRNNWDLDVWLMIDKNEFNPSIKAPYILTKELGIVNIKGKKFNLFNYLLSILHFPVKIYISITRFINKNDIIELNGEPEFFYNFWVYIISKFKKFKYIIEMSQTQPFNRYNKWYFVRLITKKVVKNASGLIFMTEKAMKRIYLSQYLDKFDKIPLLITGHPININKFHSLPKEKTLKLRNELVIDPQEKVVLFVGRINPQKGIHLILKAIKIIEIEIPNIQVLIIGSANSNFEKDYKMILTKLSKKLNISNKIKFIGYIPREKLVNYYNISDILILPSISLPSENIEAFGIVLAEAMACCVPVIGSNIGGISELIQDGYNGYLVPEGDEKSLASKIKELLLNEKLRKEMGLNGRNFINKKYDLKVLSKKYANFYIQLCK